MRAIFTPAYPGSNQTGSDGAATSTVDESGVPTHRHCML
jgi:hypothetical protein